jgi:WhiB family transcriptional regulator, redox-sensing transcriptional regulator
VEADVANEDSPRRQAAQPQSDWRQAAACRDIDPDLFFPIGTSGPAVTQIAEAKQVCCSCPVRKPCLAWAIKHYQDYGIWGGMTEPERQPMRTATILTRRRRPA